MNQQRNNSEQKEVKKTKVRAVCYIRRALAKDGETNLTRQRQSCEAVASNLNAEIVGNYEDLGASGRSLKRPGPSAMLWRLQARPKVSYVVVANRARLSRNLADSMMLDMAVRGFGASIVSADDDRSSLPRSMIRKLERTMADLDRRDRPYGCCQGSTAREANVVDSTVAEAQPWVYTYVCYGNN